MGCVLLQLVGLYCYLHGIAALIKDSCPWFFDMCELIGEWLNVVPAGLGNSSSEIDMGLSVMGEDVADEIEALNGLEQVEEEFEEFERELNTDLDKEMKDDMEASTTSVPNENPKDEKLVTVSTAAVGKTSVRPGTSKPAT